MIRAFVAACLAILVGACMSGCAGQARYDFRWFKEPGSNDLVCCEASVTSSRDVASVTLHGTRDAAGNITFDLTETGISASAPIQAQNGAVSAVAGAVSNTAAAAVKFIP